MHTLHYIALHCIALHYITLQYNTIQCMHDAYIAYITYVTLRYITLHYVTLRVITLHYVTLHYIHTYIHKYIHTYIDTCLICIHNIKLRIWLVISELMYKDNIRHKRSVMISGYPGAGYNQFNGHSRNWFIGGTYHIKGLCFRPL